jgi:HEXXH motif-containing protein
MCRRSRPLPESEVERLLAAGARTAGLVYHGMLARSLPASVREKLIGQLSAREIVTHGTPFFWLNVHRILDFDDTGDARLQELEEHLAIAAFDSFFRVIPSGARIELRAAAAPFILPNLELQIDRNARGVTLSKEDATTLGVSVEGDTTLVDLACPPAAFRLETLAVAGLPRRSFASRNAGLFEASYSGSIMTNCDLPAFVKMLADALEIIGSADPSLEEKIKSDIGWYVPIEPIDADTHASFSSPGLSGVVFLSPARDALQLAEAIVHEHGHTELNTLLRTRQLFHEVPGERYYSPWRSDARPLSGLLHALHVFCGVGEFLEKLSDVDRANDYDPQIRRRRRAIVARLKVGVQQVPPSRLVGDGHVVFDDLCVRTARLEARLGVLEKLPHWLVEHARAWEEQHPTLQIAGREREVALR